ncbi:hypothetical protein Q6D67_21485, partial [Haliea sp. E1-2-M8]|uniref:hypothetical protein n=1 Tax=Haliea sp. E1-2-M8 TaxID=3064706 RepID=UPI00271D28A1
MTEIVGYNTDIFGQINVGMGGRLPSLGQAMAAMLAMAPEDPVSVNIVARSFMQNVSRLFHDPQL